METYKFDTFNWAKVIQGKCIELDRLLKTAKKPFIIAVKRQKTVTVYAEKPVLGTYLFYNTSTYLQGENAAKIMPSTEELSEPEPEEADCHGHRLFE
jgi:hypothetical protein